MIKSIIFTGSLFTTLIPIFWLTGCTSIAKGINELRDDDFSQGCVADEVEGCIGYFDQTGGVRVCKLKCSPTLPKDYSFSYDNIRSGCKVGVGNVK